MRTGALHDICHLCTFIISSRNVLSLCKSSLSPSGVIKTGNSNYFNNTDLSIVDSFAGTQRWDLPHLSLWKNVFYIQCKITRGAKCPSGKSVLGEEVPLNIKRAPKPETDELNVMH